MALIGTPEVNRITGLIINASITVHRALGPGLLESAYSACLVYEMRALSLTVETDVRLHSTTKEFAWTKATNWTLA